jgi:hypothetical protein
MSEGPKRGDRKRIEQNYADSGEDSDASQLTACTKRKSYKINDKDGEADHSARKVHKKANTDPFHATQSPINSEDEEEDDPEEDLTELETGQIMRVHCQDFMCHHKFTLDFGRHVNFVTGANGSGNESFCIIFYLSGAFMPSNVEYSFSSPDYFILLNPNLNLNANRNRKICNCSSNSTLSRGKGERYGKGI